MWIFSWRSRRNRLGTLTNRGMRLGHPGRGAAAGIAAIGGACILAIVQRLLQFGEFQKGEAACNSSNSSAPFDDVIKARTQTVLGNIMVAQGHAAEALEMRRQALDTARKIGSQKDVIGALENLANLVDLRQLDGGAPLF